MAYFGAPVMGLDGSGNDIMILLGPDNLIEASGNSSSFNQPADWQSVSVDALFTSALGTIGFGSGVTATGTTTPLMWSLKSGSWTIGSATNLANIRNVGAVDFNSAWYVTNGTSVQTTDAVFATSPAGGLASDPATSVVKSANIDQLSKNSATVVGASQSYIGTWTSSDSWATQHVGPATLVPTGHLDTTYTFPGYSGSNAQVQYANVDAETEGFGLLGGPQLSVTRPV